MAKQFRPGDRIKFRAVTRWSSATVWRVVTGIDNEGRPEVRYGGWSHFLVHPKEVIEHRRAPKAAK